MTTHARLRSSSRRGDDASRKKTKTGTDHAISSFANASASPLYDPRTDQSTDAITRATYGPTNHKPGMFRYEKSRRTSRKVSHSTMQQTRATRVDSHPPGQPRALPPYAMSGGKARAQGTKKRSGSGLPRKSQITSPMMLANNRRA